MSGHDWLTNEDMIARARAGVAARERMRDTRKAAKPTLAELTAMVKALAAVIQAQGRRITELEEAVAALGWLDDAEDVMVYNLTDKGREAAGGTTTTPNEEEVRITWH